MADGGENDDLHLIKASQGLLEDLGKSLPRLLYRRYQHGESLRAHSYARQKDLDHVIRLIEPFQGDPQLLDASLKTIVPHLSNALIQNLERSVSEDKEHCVKATVATSILLYTLCKVRGRKIISGLLPNEPRYLELVVTALEQYAAAQQQWQVQFVLALWLAHLLLAPFDLSTISSQDSVALPREFPAHEHTPSLARRTILVCRTLLGRSAVSQHVAALALARLASRPDMQKLRVADSLVDSLLPELQTGADQDHIHLQLGILRFLAALCKTGEIDHLFKVIFISCEALANDEEHALTKDAVGRKLVLKTISTVMMSAIRSAQSSRVSADLLAESVLEATIELQLQSLSDQEGLVRNAAAKATSNIILSLDADMSRDILEAILANLDQSDTHSQTANACLWHGHILTLSYATFRRGVPLDQMSSVIQVLLRALAFEQRTMTGSIVGTSVRDAANFGLWSLSRRCTTAELEGIVMEMDRSVFVTIGLALLQSACFDPDGNIRRGSSAALQELVGRHPNTIPEGISLVQAVDFVAVGLRQRALVEVAAAAIALHDSYWTALSESLLTWRCLGSSDIGSRELAASSMMMRLFERSSTDQTLMVKKLIALVDQTEKQNTERMHGLTLCLALWIIHLTEIIDGPVFDSHTCPEHIWTLLHIKQWFHRAFEPRAIRSSFTVAVIKFATAYVRYQHASGVTLSTETTGVLSVMLQQLLTRTEPALHQETVFLVSALSQVQPKLSVISIQELGAQLSLDITKPTQQGSGRTFAAAASIEHADSGGQSQLVQIIDSVCRSYFVDWRIIGFQALREAVELNRRLDVVKIASISTTVCSGLQDYTIDQRGDIGSLVRLQAIDCAQILIRYAQDPGDETFRPVRSQIARLSLEKLNRVRVRAAQCRAESFGLEKRIWAGDCDSEMYFKAALAPLWLASSPTWLRHALLEGLISSAGTAAEHLIQNSRAVMCREMSRLDTRHLLTVAQDFAEVLKLVSSTSACAAALELLAYVLQARLLLRLVDSNFKWRNLLAIVQKAHFKSTDMQKLIAAIAVYQGLAEVPAIRTEVLKKLVSMLRTNPYPRVRSAVADAVFMTAHNEDMKTHDWSKAPSVNEQHLSALESAIIT